MAIADDDVAVAVGQVDAVADTANQEMLQRRLHDAFDADAVGLRMAADNFQPEDRRHALFLPDRLLHVFWQRRPAVGADEVQCRARAGHDDLGRAAGAFDRNSAVHGQGYMNWPSDEIVAALEEDVAIALGHGVENSGGVVILAVAASAKFTYGGHF